MSQNTKKLSDEETIQAVADLIADMYFETKSREMSDIHGENTESVVLKKD